jgi:hypothetical protein
MRKSFIILIISFVVLVYQVIKAEEVIFTDTFDSGLSKWITNYAQLNTPIFGYTNSDFKLSEEINSSAKIESGKRMETLPFIFEPGFRYTCTLKVKTNLKFDTLQGTKIQFYGYHRHNNERTSLKYPEMEDLRWVFASEIIQTIDYNWNEITVKLVSKPLSSRAFARLQQIDFLTLIVRATENDCLIDDVVITKTPEYSMQF